MSVKSPWILVEVLGEGTLPVDAKEMQSLLFKWQHPFQHLLRLGVDRKNPTAWVLSFRLGNHVNHIIIVQIQRGKVTQHVVQGQRGKVAEHFFKCHSVH